MKKILIPLLVLAVLIAIAVIRNWPKPYEPMKDVYSDAGYHANLIKPLAQYAIAVNGNPDVTALKSKKYLLLFFGNRWSDSCQKSTQKLIEFYLNVSMNGDNDIGVIYVSLDRNQTQMDNFMKNTSMPWIGLRVHSLGAARLKMRYCFPNAPCCIVLLNEKDEVVSSSYDSKGRYLSTRPMGAYQKIKKSERQRAEKAAQTEKNTKAEKASDSK